VAETAPFDFRVEGNVQAAYDLRQLGVRASDVRRIARGIRRIFVRSEQRRFDAGGPGWPPLADVTLQIKASQGLPDKILVARGRLLASLVNPQEELTHDTVRFSTDEESARFHQYGTVNMPQRVVIKMLPGDVAEMQQLLERYIGHDETP
jgi:phage gpG-like protein